MPIIAIVFWVCDLIWLLSFVIPAYNSKTLAFGSWIPWVCVTILGYIVLAPHV